MYLGPITIALAKYSLLEHGADHIRHLYTAMIAAKYVIYEILGLYTLCQHQGQGPKCFVGQCRSRKW